MGWYTMAAIGSEYGPCVEPCKHTDCAKNREDLLKTCEICGEIIGADVPMYFVGHAKEGKVEHLRCVMKRENARRANNG